MSMLWDHQKSMPDNICQLQPEKLVPIVMTPALWGHKWQGMVVQFVSDNKAVVVAVLNSGYTGDGVLMHLLRCSFLIAASFRFWYSACHILGSSG